MGAKVTDLIDAEGRVTGVRYQQDGSSHDLTARLVIGADGRNSTIAGLVGSRKYNVVPGERFGHWAFYEGADLTGTPTLVFHRWADRLVIACPADNGLYQVVMMIDPAARDRFRADLAGSFDEYARSCEPVAKIIKNARVSGKIFGFIHFDGYFREATGSGWALIGDAGHFKDPAPGQGIGDAFRQAETMAPAILEGLRAGDVDARLSPWARWRDEDAQPMYWFAIDLGKEGLSPMVVPEMARRIKEKGEFDRFLRVFAHRQDPTELLTPGALLSATGRLMIRRGTPRRQLLSEVRQMIIDDTQRKRFNKTPVFATETSAAKAG